MPPKELLLMQRNGIRSKKFFNISNHVAGVAYIRTDRQSNVNRICRIIIPSNRQDTGWLIIIVSLWVVEVYQIYTAYFSQVMHFIVTWLCVVRKGKGSGHPTPFNSWLSTPRNDGMGCAVRGHVCMQVYECVYVYAHLVPALYEDPTRLRADNCTYRIINGR
jgi:hypothetical protein